MHPVVHEVLSGMWAETPKRLEGGHVCPVDPHVFVLADGRRLKPDWVSHEFARVVAKAGVAPCTLHDLRRSFSTLAQRAGVDKFIVRDLGGWSSVSVVDRHYTGDVGDVYRQAMQRIAEMA